MSLQGTPEDDTGVVSGAEYQGASSGTVGMRRESKDSPTTRNRGQVPENVIIKNRKSPHRKDEKSMDQTTFDNSSVARVP